jgi:hypothetical protein
MTDGLSTADKINTALLAVTMLGVLITTAGVVAAFLQIRTGSRAQRAVFLKDLYMQLRTDPEIVKAFYLIEYSEFRYDADFHGSDDEPRIDRLLTLVDLICELHAQSVITKREMAFFEYQFRRIANDKEIVKYLTFLQAFYARNGLDRKPFSAFRAYAAAL